MKAALLIGNGLNRCYEDNDSQISWSSLLQKIADHHEVAFISKNSFPLEFECLVNSICEKKDLLFDKVLTDAKKTIATHVESLMPPNNSIHYRFMDLPIDEIMTTNYDYVLERAISPDEPFFSTDTATKYSLRRKAAFHNKQFHHIHGEARKPSTLCLGYEHYAGYLANMRDYVKNTAKMQTALQQGNLSRNDSWIDLFFTHDIHIVGLTLDVCEIDLWWLLTYRAQLFHTNPNIHKNLKNEITLYSTKDPKSKEFFAQKALFERLHVNVVSIPPKQDASGKPDYLSAYKSICGMIEDSVLQRHII